MTSCFVRWATVALAVFTVPVWADGSPQLNDNVADDIFYHFMPIAWRDSDNDGIAYGDFDGMTASLDYLEELGVTAVWMNPIFPTNAYHGYQHGPADQINPRFGNQAEFQNFINEAHARGIKVFVDLVVYGISHNTVWFQDAFGNPGSQYDDWLAFNNGGNTQYLGSFYNSWNGSGVGFIHWDLRNAQTTALVTDWSQKWLDPNNDGDPSDGIDGYRLDHVWAQYPNGPNGWGYNIDWWQDWNAALESVKPEVFIFAEQADWGSTGANLLSAFDAAFTKPFEFAARRALENENASELYASMASTFGSLPAGKQYLGIIGDHDVDRLASVIGDSLTKGRAAAAVLMTQPFPPVIYFGDEIGMRGIKQDYGSDANDIPFREPFKWNAVHSFPMTNYWILNSQAYNNRYSQNNDGRSVEEQSGVTGSLLEHYKTLIAARRDNIALRRGNYTPITNSSSRIWSFVRESVGEQTLLVVINVAGFNVNTTLDLGDADIVGGSTTVRDVITDTNLPTALTDLNKNNYLLSLEGYGYRVLEINASVEPPIERINGDNIPADMGLATLRATQDNFTSMGDNISELNQLFAMMDDTHLNVGITGNLATDGTAMAIFLDTQPGGQNVLDTASFSEPPAGIPQIDGMVLDAGFAPDYIVYVNAFSGSIYADLYTLSTSGGGSKRYLGNGNVGSGTGALSGGTNPNGALVAIRNTNVLGVTGSSADNADTAISGFEMELPLADINLAADAPPIRLMATLVRTDGSLGNQTLPGLGFGTGELGTVPIDFNTIPGDQFITLDQGPTIPAASTWTLIQLTLLLLSAATIIFRRGPTHAVHATANRKEVDCYLH